MPSSSDIITPILLLRSSTASKRPDPADLLPGQPAINYNSSDPGLYFSDSTLSELLKIGPCHVGPTEPNGTPAIGGYAGKCVGESWLDTSDPERNTLKIWDGSAWLIAGQITPNTFFISNTLWVDVDGDDSNTGRSPIYAKKTIQAALDEATAGMTIRVSPGSFIEDNPLIFSDVNITISGAGSQITEIVLENDADLFHMRSGSVVQDFTFSKETAVTNKAITRFIPTGAGTIVTPPLVKDCVANVEGAIGILADGNASGGLKTFSSSDFKVSAENSVGFKCLNKAFIEADGCETTYAQTSMLTESGGTIRATNCKSVYGEYGLVSNGISDPEQTGEFATIDALGTHIQVDDLSETLRPYEGQVLTVGGTFFRVCGFLISDPGDGYTSPPQVIVSLGSGPNPVAAEGFAVIEDGQVVDIVLTEPGQGYSESDVVTVTFVGGTGCPAHAEAVLSPIYYTVNTASEIAGNSSVVCISEPLPYSPSPGDEVVFYRMSKIVAHSHYFGYLGTGSQTPFEGGSPVPENEVVEQDGGRVFVSSMNQSGNFRVGKEFCISQVDNVISGFTFSNSVLAAVLPIITAID